MAELTESINQLGMHVPVDFRRFMEAPELVYRIRCVGCQFVNQGQNQLCPAGTRGCLIPFLCDEEDIFTWYLYIDDKSRHCVVGKPTRFDENTCEGDAKIDRILRTWWFVAPTFEAFLFRYWIENAIWISLTVENLPLTPMQLEYVSHYNAD
jgi:hypothetical protein